MSTHLIIRGPDIIDRLHVTVDAIPRVNEHIAFSDVLFRVTKVVHLITMNRVRVEVVQDL